MPLSLEQRTETPEKSTKSQLLLNKYLTDAVALTHSDTLIEAHRDLSDFSKRPLWDNIKIEDIEAKRAEIKKELKDFKFTDRAAYYANIKAGEHKRETLIKAGAVLGATLVAAAISPELGKVVGGAAAAYVLSKNMAWLSGTPLTPKELFSTRDNDDLKHAQLALRKLSHRLEKKELDEMKQKAIQSGAYMPVFSGRGGMCY